MKFSKSLRKFEVAATASTVPTTPAPTTNPARIELCTRILARAVTVVVVDMNMP